jgi:iron complex outermembrane receptor protein
MSRYSAIDSCVMRCTYAAWPLSIAGVVLATPALAQSTPAEASSTASGASETAAATGADLSDIIVTAQFRGTRVQDTPLAITAVSGELLEARGQTNVTQVSAQAPNVTIVQGGSIHGGATAQSYIRGIGQFDSNFAYEPGVGMYIDDVYYATTFGSAFQLLDIDRVEILRGPQGTLSGKNAIGGSVKLYSRKPSGEPEAFVEATVGSFNRIDLRAGANFAIVDDRLFARISGSSQHRDGYLTRYDYACATNSGTASARIDDSCKLGTQGGRDFKGVRGALRYIASDAVELNIIGDFTRDQSETSASILLAAPPFGGVSFLDGTPFDNRFVSSERYTSYGTYCAGSGGIYASPGGAVTIPASQAFCVPTHNDFTDAGVSGTIDWQLGDNLSLKSITAYRSYHGGFGDDTDQSPLDYQTNTTFYRHHQFSQELRLTGRLFGELVDWTIGGFYYKGSSRQSGRTHFPGQRLDFIYSDPVHSENTSAFAHAELHPIDRLNLTFGIRYTDDQKDYLFSRRDPDTGLVPPPLAGINGLFSEFQGANWDYKAGIDYRLTPEVMAYGQWSTGFRGGGINARPLFSNQRGIFQPETLNAYELGLKTTFFDRRVRVNVAAFLNKYDDIVIDTSSPYFNPDLPVDENPASPNYNPAAGTFPANVPINAGSANIKGVEIEAFLEPLPGLTIDASYSTLDFEYTRLSASALASGLTLDSPHVFTPKNKWSVGIQYDWVINGLGTVTPRFDVNHQASLYTRDTALVQPYPTFNVVPSYTVANAQVRLKTQDGGWEAVVEVRNLFNRYYLFNSYDLQFLNSTAVGQPAPPREWSLTLRRRF